MLLLLLLLMLLRSHFGSSQMVAKRSSSSSLPITACFPFALAMAALPLPLLTIQLPSGSIVNVHDPAAAEVFLARLAPAPLVESKYDMAVVDEKLGIEAKQPNLADDFMAFDITDTVDAGVQATAPLATTEKVGELDVVTALITSSPDVSKPIDKLGVAIAPMKNDKEDTEEVPQDFHPMDAPVLNDKEDTKEATAADSVAALNFQPVAELGVGIAQMKNDKADTGEAPCRNAAVQTQALPSSRRCRVNGRATQTDLADGHLLHDQGAGLADRAVAAEEAALLAEDFRSQLVCVHAAFDEFRGPANDTIQAQAKQIEQLLGLQAASKAQEAVNLQLQQRLDAVANSCRLLGAKV